MARTPNLLPKYSSIIRRMTPANLANPETLTDLAVDQIEMNNKRIEMVYAPFDHVNLNARIVIVGLTPGKQQAANALRAAQNALARGASDAEAGEEAKVFASFSGPMRANLVKMLDFIGVPTLLGIASTAELWDQHQSLVHFTSALRYPVFVDGKNWSGQPDMVRILKCVAGYKNTQAANLRCWQIR